MLKLASFNINGTNARLPRLLEWLDETAPDVVGLQEIKCVTEQFPRAPFEDRGYSVAVLGQKGFNGVVLLSRLGLEDVTEGLPGDPGDEQARYIEAQIGPVRVGNLYLPNGNPQPGPKFDYKLGWMERLIEHAARLRAADRPFMLLGDYNVCPTDADLFSVRAMAGDALVQPESRAAFRRLLHLGLTDALRAVHPVGPLYTFWDYQAGAWPRDHGLRIDHILLCPHSADRLRDAGVDKAARGRDKASDHAPVWAQLAF